MISAVIITKNEEHQITRCLGSLKPWVTEMIVVDDGSTDRTVSLAKEAGAKVVAQTSKGNFDGQRNLGIDTATSPWILQMDADEVIPVETAEAVRRALVGNPSYAAFTLIRRDHIFGVPLKNTYIAPGVKLFRKDKGRYVAQKIHEVLKIDGSTGPIPAFVEHYNIVSISKTIEKYNYYTDIESQIYWQKNPELAIATLKKNLMGRTLKLFYKNYVKHKAYKDGVYGLIWAILHVLYPLLHWLKVGEIAIKEKRLKD